MSLFGRDSDRTQPDYYSTMARLGNEYRAMQNRAKAARRANDDMPSSQEGMYYRKAAEICSELARISTEDERQHWIAQMELCEDRAREIAYALNPAEKEADDSDSKSDSGGKETHEKKPHRSARDFPTPEMIEKWTSDPPKHGFGAVAGMEALKKKLLTSVLDIKTDKLNKRLDMDTVQSFFFYGLAGCGKTFIIKAFAYEMMHDKEFKFISLSGADIHNQYVGQTEKVIDAAFDLAIDLAPSILFIDEIDGVCVERSTPNLPSHVTSATNAFLTGYNKLSDCKKQIIFIAATNYPERVDSAMRDRIRERLRVPLPDFEVRRERFRKNFENILILSPEMLDTMASATENYNQRDIDRLVNNLKISIKGALLDQYGDDQDCAIKALDSGSFTITKEMFEKAIQDYFPEDKTEALDRMTAYEKRRRTAYR